MAMKEAIVVRNARKLYGDNLQILDGLDFTVLRSTIYGLLGASGCGKTTLLSCVVGVKTLDSGEVWVLGGKPGTKGSGIPGPKVGYMPQNVALIGEFTVISALYYFGYINGMKSETIEERYRFLSKLLQLPPRNQLVNNMSGGQKRRVSFAAALIHKPQLLILDEPTVGIDPVLRENIWDYLVKLTQEEGTTVVITTHYIEEARQANTIGLLRCGKLLAEMAPNQLLLRFRCQTLEEAFLILSQKQKDGQEFTVNDTPSPSTTDIENVSILATQGNDYDRKTNNANRGFTSTLSDNLFNGLYISMRKYKALMTKNLQQFVRHPSVLAFAFIFPVIQLGAFFQAIGPDPKGLIIAVVNQEAADCDHGTRRGTVFYVEEDNSCNFVDLSCRFLHGFNDSIADKVFYDDVYEAHASVKSQQSTAVMYFGRNFSLALQNRMEDPKSAEDEDIVASEIQMWLDMGSRQIAIYLQKKLSQRFFEIFEIIMKECGALPKVARLPISFEEPIFGEENQSYGTTMAPGLILTLIFFLAITVSSSIIITDRHEGVWHRSLVQGVTTTQILSSHILTQLVSIFLQLIVTLFMSFLLCGLECKGSMTAVAALCFLVGICGLFYGFLISVLCTSHSMANYISTGTFYPMILLSGSIWPLEGMPKLLQWVSIFLPTTVPSISLTGLLQKGYSMNEPAVYKGFLVILGWSAGLFILCLCGLKRKMT